MSEITNCPNCNSKLKNGVFADVFLMSDEQNQLISDLNNSPLAKHCSKCGEKPYKESVKGLAKMRLALQVKLKESIEYIPIVTTHSPQNWTYKVLGIVTGQSTSGTGLLSEFKSGWTDLFGMQSSAYNQKIALGEQLCSQQLRAKAVSMGGDAVIAADIDYSELGAEKGMIMVCMSGTAVKIDNSNILPPDVSEMISAIPHLKDRLNELNSKYPDAIRYAKEIGSE